MRPQLQLQYKTENISWLTNDVIRVSDIFPPSPLELIWVVQVFVDMEYGWEDLILDDHDQDVETQLIFLSIVRLFLCISGQIFSGAISGVRKKMNIFGTFHTTTFFPIWWYKDTTLAIDVLESSLNVMT